MGLRYYKYLSNPKIYSCSKCRTHLSLYDDIVSREFQGQHGKAYLFNNVVNVNESRPESRLMRTGRHIVRDIHCKECSTVLGWKYEKAYEESQKFKEGKYILEAELIILRSGAAPALDEDIAVMSNGTNLIRTATQTNHASQ